MIYIAGDHHAEPALIRIRQFLASEDRSFEEFGYRSGENPKSKLVDFIPKVAHAVSRHEDGIGILVCGTGAGVEIGANRFHGIRASLCSTPQAAEWARVYDAANVLCLASWSLPDLPVESILTQWFASEYDGSESRRQMFQAFDSWAGNSSE